MIFFVADLLSHPCNSSVEIAARLQILGIRIRMSAISKIEDRNRSVTDIEIAAITKILKMPGFSLPA